MINRYNVDSARPLELTRLDSGQIIEFEQNFVDGTEVHFAKGRELAKRKLIQNNKVQIPSELLLEDGVINAWVTVVEEDSTTTIKHFKILAKEKNDVEDVVSPEDEPTFREEIQKIMNDTKEIAQSVRDDASAGKFNGQDGEDGKISEEQVAEITKNIKLDLSLEFAKVDETGNKINLSINPNDYVMTFTLLDKDNNILDTSTVDLPLETMVVGAEYDKTNKSIILTLQNGQTVSFSVADLVSGLVSTEKLNTKLQDYVKNTDYATSEKYGVVKFLENFGLNANILGNPFIVKATDEDIINLSDIYKPIVPSNLKKAVETIGGVLSELETTDKSSFVGAINELNSDIEQKLDKPETAQVGQIFCVQSITEDGNFVLEAVDMPSGGDVTDVQIDDSVASPKKTWSSQKISDELEECVKFVKIAINLIGSEGNVPLGNTVYVYETVNEIETLSYSVLCPDGTITVRVPHGIQYRITASTDAEGFYAPADVTGVAINNSEATIRYTELAHPKTIRDLQILAKMGLAANVVAIGDEFTTTYTYNGNEFEMPWIVTDIKEVEFEDGSTGQGVYLEAKYTTIESIQFDAPHQEVATEETAIEGLYYIGRTDNTYTLLTLNTGDTIPYSDYTYIYHDTIRDASLNIYKYGHNRVQTSALRQWLNSDADRGAWWTAPKIGYCPPSQLNSIKGFMAGLSQDFLDCVAKVKRTYYTNLETDGSVIDVLYDKFFSATGTELYGSVNDNEGTYFPYYKEVTGLSAPSNNQNTGRIKYVLNAKTSSLKYWTFSNGRSYSCCVWICYTTGQLSYIFNSASISCGAVPACVIG